MNETVTQKLLYCEEASLTVVDDVLERFGMRGFVEQTQPSCAWFSLGIVDTAIPRRVRGT